VPIRQRNKMVPAIMIMGSVIQADSAMYSRHIHC
jgi:hypothetical protein